MAKTTKKEIKQEDRKLTVSMGELFPDVFKPLPKKKKAVPKK